MSERYIAIRNWERFQHKDVWRKSGGRPPWIKAYTALLHDDDFLALSHAARGILLGLWLMYASAGKAVSEVRAKRSLSADRVQSRCWSSAITSLNDAGFIQFESRETRAPGVTRGEESRYTPPTPPQGGNGKHPERISTKGYTGCRFVRGEVGAAAKYDPLGRDRPPADWPHEKPTRDEIRKALEERESVAI